jgi:tetratricopeptide (TPR) repeat protein
MHQFLRRILGVFLGILRLYAFLEFWSKKDIYFSLAIIYHNLGINSKSIKNYKKALAVNNRDTRLNFDIHCALAGIYSNIGDYNGLLEECQKANEIKDSDPQIQAFFGYYYLKCNDMDKAIEVLERTIKHKSCEPESYQYLGCAYLNKERYAEGIEQLKKAIAMKCYLLDYCYYTLGVAYESIGDNKKALEAYKTVNNKYKKSEYLIKANERIKELTCG